MKKILSYYHPKMPIYLVYMLQQVEYEPNKFLTWLIRLPNLRLVMHRQTLVMTAKAKILVLLGYAVWLAVILCSAALLIMSDFQKWLGIAGIIISPDFVILSLYLSVGLAWLFIETPRRISMVKRSREIFANHKAIKIAILGSYGKTTIKDLLLTVLSEGKNVAATPGNKNVAVSHARFAANLSGGEEILLIEYGEAAPGDIAKFAEATKPDYAIIAGLAPNHLDKYKTIESVKKDLFSIEGYVEKKNIFSYEEFSEKGFADVEISAVKMDITGMEFTATIKGGKKLNLKTELVGRHLLGPLSVCISLASRLGISNEQIEKGISNTSPFEHRLQPRNLQGAWLIDDTYNGSIEGFRAGLKLLKELKAKRKIYVTPGLVDQGEETENVHREIGKLIAECAPDKVVLMHNSVTRIIKSSLEENGYKGMVEVRDDPLEFYANIEHTLAAGDLVLMQNDWTDNYT